MAVLIAKTNNGNWTDSTTWGVVDSTSYLNAENATESNLTTAYSGTRSQAFTPGAITVDGIAVKLCERITTTGTISVHLALNSTHVEVAGTEVVINVADLPSCLETDLNGGWIFFKFASPVSLSAATAYEVEAKVSSNGSVDLWCDGTTDNLSRALRTTTEAAPGAGDNMIITAEKTGAGAQTNINVVMNETATTDYGSGGSSSINPAVSVCDGGTLTWGTSAATNYYLKLSGYAIVYAGGTWNQGTTGTPIPRDSTAILEFDATADGDFGMIIRNLGTLNMQGLSRTSGKDIFTCKLNTDEAVNSTSLGVDTDTGWLDNDEIVVCSTTRTPGQTEKGTLNGNAGASSLTVDGFGGVGGGLANAHGGGGTAGVVAEVINITRNVKVRSATSTSMTFILFEPTAVVDIDWVEFYYIGENSGNKRGVECKTTTGTVNIQYSSIHDTEDFGFYISGASGNGVTFNNNVMWNCNSAAASTQAPLWVVASTGVSTISGNVIIGCACQNSSTSGIVKLSDAGVVFTNNAVSGNSGGTSMGAIVYDENGGTMGTFTGNSCHSNAGVGLYFVGASMTKAEVGTFTAWRNASNGININSQPSEYLLVDTATLFGNGGVNMISGSTYGVSIWKNVVADSDATFTTTAAITVPNSNFCYLINCNFGSTNAHTSSDITSFSTNDMKFITCINTILATSTENSTATILGNGAFIKKHKRDQSSTTFRAEYRYGIIDSETTTRHTASGYSWKMTPNTANLKLILPGPSRMDTFKSAVNASSLVTVKAWVQKDGSYNGNAPRLVLVGGVVGGITSDVTASLTVGASTWEELTVTGTPNESGTVEFYIDCDGTAGSIYVDDITVTQA